MQNTNEGRTGKKPTIDEMLPPAGMEDVGGGDFKAIGLGIASTLKNLFSPDQKFLDMGCGIGRVAIPLTQYVSDQGQYEGFDVVPSAIAYCQARITPWYPNFGFTHSDIYNGRYNPNGKERADAYQFPYGNAFFDIASATSLFTHLQPKESVRYINEAARVLKPGGTILATFFLVDDIARKLLGEKKASIYFPHQVDSMCWVADKDIPEAAVSYDKEFVVGLFSEAGFDIQSDIHWGSWSGRSIEWGGFQDTVIAIKR